MGLSAGLYSMQCWNSTQNPSEVNDSRLSFQCLQLIKALQKRFSNGEIAIPSTDTKIPGNRIEICILYRPEKAFFADIADFLTQNAKSMGLAYRNFVKQDTGITRYFDQREMDNVSVLDDRVPDDLTEKAIADGIERAKNFKGYRMNDSWKNATAAEHRGLPFQIPRPALQRLHTKEGAELAAEISSIARAVQVAKDEVKTSFAIINMVAKGALFTSYIAVDGFRQNGMLVFLILVVLAAGVLAFTGPLGFLVTLAAAQLVFKDAANALLVVNDTPNDVLPRMEWIQNGERKAVPEMIPATAPNSDLVSCGLFIYTKYQIKSINVSAYGSAFGVSFDSGNGKNFSVGMDCPNSFVGGNNSIEVHNGEHAQKACQMALDSGNLHGWCNQPYVDVKIADHWGNINWGRAVVMKD